MASDNLLSRWGSLSSEERERFSSVLNYLIEHTFMLSRVYGTSENGKRGNVWNDDYTFADIEFDLLGSYFKPLGYELKKDSRLGLIYLDNTQRENVSFSWDSTVVLYALRLLYDERIDKILDTLMNVPVKMSEIFEMLDRFNKNNFVTKTGSPIVSRFRSALDVALKHNIVTKITAGDIDMDTLFLIHPSITVIFSIDRIRQLESAVLLEDGDE